MFGKPPFMRKRRLFDVFNQNSDVFMVKKERFEACLLPLVSSKSVGAALSAALNFCFFIGFPLAR